MPSEIKLNVPFKFQKTDKGCLLACVEMVARYHRGSFSIADFVKKNLPTRYGYDIFYVADQLKKQGYNLETGHFDKDLKIDKYSKIAKKVKPDLNKIKSFLKNKKPVIVHLSAKRLGAREEEEIHAVVVIGFNAKGFFILNPPKIGEEYVSSKDFIRFWEESGSYYLVIKK